VTGEEFDKLVKDRGYDKPKATPAPAPTPTAPAAAPAAPAAAAPAKPGLDPLRAENPREHLVVGAGWPPGSPGLDITQSGKELRDFGRGVLNTGGDVRRLAHTIAPNFETSLETLAKKVPGAQWLVRKGREFTHQPDEEPIGRTVGQLAPLAAVDLPAIGARMGLGAYQTTMYPQATAKIMDIMNREHAAITALGQGKGLVKKVAAIKKQFQAEREAFKDIARGGRRIFEGAGKGAGIVAGGTAGGMIANPEHPKEGAAVGALTSVAPLPLRSRLARWTAGQAVPIAAAEIAHRHFGLPRAETYGLGLGSSIFWHRSPLGRRLHRVGSKLVDDTGALIGEYSQVAGYEAEKFNREHPQYRFNEVPDAVRRATQSLSEAFSGQTEP